MEYMQSELRCEQRAKVHYLSETNSTKHLIDKPSNATATNELSVQMKQNQEILQKVVDGLAHISDIVCQGNQLPHNTRMSRMNSQKLCWYHDTDSHDINHCWTFNRMDVNSKIDCLRKNRACFICLRIGHISKGCPNRKGCEHCGKMHHSTLHQGEPQNKVNNCLQLVNGEQFGETVVLMVSEVRCKDDNLFTLWDPGSNISLISHTAAKRLNMKGIDVTLRISKVGNIIEHLHAKEYIVPLTDVEGETLQIKAYGMEKITTHSKPVDISGVSTLFKGISDSDISRTDGEIELLIGADCSILLPVNIESAGNLQLMKNQFGYCLRGSHSMLKLSAIPKDAYINYLSGIDINSMQVIDTKSLKEHFDSFLDIDSLGTYCNPKCGGCRCGQCSVGNGRLTIQEEHELRTIEAGLEYDTSGKCWTASYPWKNDPVNLPNNIKAAFGRLKSVEQRLINTSKEYAQEYHTQIEDMIHRRAARKLTSTEINSYEGPVHYISHHEVLKPGSKSTPLRIVFNSSASFMGHVLNNYWMKGPKVLNDLISVLLKFRENQIALVGDI